MSKSDDVTASGLEAEDISIPMTCNSSVASIAFHPTNGRLLCGLRDGSIGWWELDARRWLAVRECRQGFPPLAPVNSVTIMPDGTWFTAGLEDSTVSIWEVEGGDVVSGPFLGQIGAITAVAFSPDGRMFRGSAEGVLCSWSPKSGQSYIGFFSGGLGGRACGATIASIAISPDGTKLACGSHDNIVRVWSTDNPSTQLWSSEGGAGTAMDAPGGHTGRVKSVVFTPSGRQVVSGSYDGTIRIWDAATGQLAKGPFALDERTENLINSVAISPDGRTIATGSNDGIVRLWNFATGKMIISMPQHWHMAAVNCVAFSPDNRFIASASSDTSVRLLDYKAFFGLLNNSSQSSLDLPGTSLSKPKSKRHQQGQVSRPTGETTSLSSSILDLPAIPQPIEVRRKASSFFSSMSDVGLHCP
ncbi:WD40 repeat-like protein [Leucogyrophana mollusca]|uniref:WD40 repeat-like protein n=1 Tax=Leucogyrophana mollusca TaxID=85980 RepID=A0ACB8BBL2_9AGAM|nr:WD40 repeat-like protein [Leucogyrophana mollusca]